jgi:RimJ/RimL family protein N-acetyltransferase
VALSSSSAGFLAPVVLSGARLQLRPLDASDEDALAAIGLDPSLWERTTTRLGTRDEMRAYIRAALDERDAGTALPFVMIDRQARAIVGTTRFQAAAPAHRRVEIGHTWVGRASQRHGFASESKALMLAHAFETLGCQRVEFTCDAANTPARAALRSLGAKEEGVLRHYVRSPHAGPRDVTIFSILSREWPALKQRLSTR